jgi:hypothetical protein
VLPEPRVVSVVVEQVCKHACDGIVSLGSGGRLDLERALSMSTVTTTTATTSETPSTSTPETPTTSTPSTTTSAPAAFDGHHDTANLTRVPTGIAEEDMSPLQPSGHSYADGTNNSASDASDKVAVHGSMESTVDDMHCPRAGGTTVAAARMRVTAVDTLASDIVVDEGVTYVEATNGHTQAVTVGPTEALLVCWGITLTSHPLSVCWGNAYFSPRVLG